MSEQKKLTEALEAVERLDRAQNDTQERLQKFIAFCEQIVNEDQAELQRFQSSLGRGLTDYTLDNVSVWAERKARAAAAREIQQLFLLRSRADVVFENFKRRFPDLRTVLRTAAECRLKKAQADLQRVRAAETKRLGAKGLADRVSESPEVKVEQSKVDSARYVLNAVNSDPEEVVWRNAKLLLSNS
jgi:hypothetical protein